MGIPIGIAVLFASFYDSTVRSFTLTAPEPTELGQILLDRPFFMLWVPRHNQLLVAEFAAGENGKNVRSLSVNGDGRALELVGTPITSDMQVSIECWCRIDENSIAIFDREKKELLLFDMT